MHDVKWIREHPEEFDAALQRRGLEPCAAEIVALDAERRRLMAEQQEAQSERNVLSKEIGRLKASGGSAEAVVAQVAALKDRLAGYGARLAEVSEQLKELLDGLPNILANDVPDGRDEIANVEVSRHGRPRSFDFTPKEHYELGSKLGMDFESAARMAGPRLVVLVGQLAHLSRALGQLMLDVHTREHGYVEVAPPLLVADEALYGTGQLPKFREDLFYTFEDFWLIPTAEVPLTNLVAGRILDEAELPSRFTALTPCFRSEAGAAGKDTRGMIRQHQFDKVELVSITTPEQSDAEHERMTACAETILDRLGLAFRRVVLCSGDTGFAARKTYDVEVWLPGQGRYREISSCSTCGDFQARRMNARYRPKGEKATRFVHTLNGSGVAVGRALIAVLETYQREDGSVDVPDVLAPYMSGIERLVPHAA